MALSTTGRPRDAAVSVAILEATLDLLAEVGFGRFTVDAVVARAGSAKPTVYRRWASKEALVAAALDHAFSFALTIPDTGSLREDLLALNKEFLASFDTRTGRLTFALIAESIRDERWGSVLAGAQRASRQRSAAIVRQAIERGELPADVDGNLLMDLAAGPLWSHGLVWRDLATHPPDIAAIVDRVLMAFPPPQR